VAAARAGGSRQVQVTGDVQSVARMAGSQTLRWPARLRREGVAGYLFPVRFNLAPTDGMTRSRSRGKMKQPSTDGIVQAGVLAS
jgi:hypothetical protein